MTDPLDAFDLDGRVAVITGAGSGIGEASARMLAAVGAELVCADLDLDAAERVADAIRDDGGRARAARCDVSVRDEVDDLVERVFADLGHVDVMGNIAGIMHESLVVDTKEDDLDRVLGINLKGVFFGCQAAARVMIEQGSGSIINMSSGAIDVAAPNIVCYAMAKAAVAQLTKTLAVEVGPLGVRVNAIAPGFIITGMTGRHWRRPDGTIDEDLLEQVTAPMRERSTLGRVGNPDDIAYAVLYLASDAADFMTGQILRPNGGVAMP
ncbi:MAG TPA: SDR family NAD(P)-dependent oxidoreductase [Acidimicrobiia bacterium]|nr:SDR family NAD(P)-dependent oxidoreductase [Acidimicrobiia bacterium]